MKKQSTEQFIIEAKKKHADKYDYSNVEYKNYNTKVIIICKIHGEFEQAPAGHLAGKHCAKCSGKYKPSQIEFINNLKEKYGNKFDYSKVIYKTNKNKIILTCVQHDNEFQQTAKECMNGQNGCTFCQKENKLLIAKQITKSPEQFIIDAIKTHGDKYDYSKVEYINSHTKVILICKEHGEFIQEAASHLAGHGCKFCSANSTSEKQRSNSVEFIDKAIKIHGDKYDYSKVDYKTAIIKVVIICKEHGEYEQSPNSHLAGKRCVKCYDDIRGQSRKSNTEEFIEKAIEIHGDKYDYSKVIYNNSKINITIICKKHGEFEQTPSGHLSGFGCINCGNDNMKIKQSKTKEEFIKESKIIHGDIYDYSKVEYTNSHTDIILICKIHGEFEQLPTNHLKGRGCKKCATLYISGLRRGTTEEFIEKAIKIHGDTLDYSKVEYISCDKIVKIICKKHGEFEQTPFNHLKSSLGCPTCVPRKYSMKAIKYIDFIAKYNNIFIQHQCNNGEHRIINTKYSADGYCKETNTIYEFHGTQFHGDPRICKPTEYNYLGKNYGEIYQKTLIREQLIRDLGYNLVVMWEYDWDNIIKSVKILQRNFRSNR